jgi:hypothetical protein
MIEYGSPDRPGCRKEPMDIMENCRLWAVSGLGWGRGETVEEAVRNHDEIVGRDWGKMLSVPINEVGLAVWECPDWATGFVTDGSLRWTAEGHGSYKADPEKEIRAVRRPDPHWLEWADEVHLQYETLA